jgi:hypothetical protein
MMGDQLTDSRMSLAPESNNHNGGTFYTHTSSSDMASHGVAEEVVHPCTLLQGFEDRLSYGGSSQEHLERIHAPIIYSTFNHDMILQSGQRDAAAPSSLVGLILLTDLECPVIASAWQIVDVVQLTEKMLYAATDPFNGCLMSSWAELPGRPGSVVRLREVPNYGAGLAFFPWANHRRMQYPNKYDVVMDFENHTVPGGPYIITLEPGDALVWCPAKYIWPACVLCGKFLFPCDAHRCSPKHVRQRDWWWHSLNSLHSLDTSRRSYLFGFLQKNLRGLANPW